MTKNTHYRDGNVVLFLRSDSEKYQARIKLENGKWKRFGTGTKNIKEASSLACKRFDELPYILDNNIPLDTRLTCPPKTDPFAMLRFGSKI